MGYLDGSSVTVDAILTNYGRRKLAEKGRLGIQYYTFGDTGVDYYLYDPGHPSGSNSMGNAITRTPQLEASPDYVVGMRYTLTTMPRTTYFIPKIVADDITVADTTEASKEWIRPQTQKFDERGETYDITIYNAEALSIDTPPDKRLSSHVRKTPQPLLPESNYPEINVWHNKKELPIKARATKKDLRITYKAYGRASGQLNFGMIYVPANMP